MSSPSLDIIFEAMQEGVRVDATIRKKFPYNVEFEIDGRSCLLKASSKQKVDLKVKTSRDVLLQLLDKKITPQQAFLKGKLKIKGKMGLAMKLTLVLNATRRQLAKQTTSRL